MIEDLALAREVVVRDRKIDIRMLVWTLVVGCRRRGSSLHRRAYETATDYSICPSNFYDRFTEESVPHKAG